MSIQSHRRRVVVETVEDGLESAAPEKTDSPQHPKHWQPGEIHSALSEKLGSPQASKDKGGSGVDLPSFFSQTEAILKDAPSSGKDELLDLKGMVDRGLGSLSSMQSIAMSVPAFLTVLALFTGVAFFAGRFSAMKSDQAEASEPPPTITPISPSSQTQSGPVQGTPDEIIRSVRAEFSTAIEASKRTDQTQAEKEEISKSILHVLDVLGKAITAYPDVASLYFERAQVEKMVMQSAPSLRPQAESDYKKSLSLSPLTGEYYVGFADYYDVTGDKSLAVSNYEKALQLDPRSIDALYPLAKLYISAGRRQEARDLYTRISGLLSPSSPQYTQIQQEIAALEPTPQPQAPSVASDSASPAPAAD